MELVKQDGNDSSLDMLIRRAVGKDPFLSFPRPDNNPVQLFQLLNNLERPGNLFFLNAALRLSHMIGSETLSLLSNKYFSRIGISGLVVI